MIYVIAFECGGFLALIWWTTPISNCGYLGVLIALIFFYANYLMMLQRIQIATELNNLDQEIRHGSLRERISIANQPDKYFRLLHSTCLISVIIENKLEKFRKNYKKHLFCVLTFRDWRKLYE